MRTAQLGKYKILDKLGQGAMGEVFRAHDPVLGRDVAVKITSRKMDDDEPARQRFLREARAAAQLNHPNIVTIYDFGDEQGVAYIAMELLSGSDLRTLIEKNRIHDLQDKLSLMEQILDGVGFAHSKGLVHRDLKPGNIHVLTNGQVKIMDFGLARREQDAAASATVMGTPYYMAPEQAYGQAFTARSDVFSLGAVFYELLAGKRPFTGNSIPAVLYAVAHRDPEPLLQAAPDLPPELVPLVERALSKSPEARYADAAEMLAALRIVWAGGEVPAAAEHPTFEVVDEAPPKPLGPPLTGRPDLPVDLKAALEETTDYLEDRIPPLMVVESVRLLTGVKPEPMAAELWAWAEKQLARTDFHPLVDLLYHALHKLAVIGELDLVPKEPLIAFLREVGSEIVAALDPTERDGLRRALRHLGEAEMVRTGPFEAAHVAEPAVTARVTPGLKRLSVIEQRLRRSRGAPHVRQQIVSQAITAAATEARNERELEDHLRRLRALGVASGADQVFRSLGAEIPDWAVPKHLAETAELGPADEVRAMQKIVSLPEDPLEVARRYRHLVTAAVEQFNAGNLGGAIQMFELATQLAAEKKVQGGYTEPIRARGHESLEPTRVREYLEQERREELRRVMAFFVPGLSPEALLDGLETEQRRDRRRLLLDLLVVHGASARALAVGRLCASLTEPVSDFARRNWIYLLRLLPRQEDEPLDAEVETVSGFAQAGNPPFLVKEALLHLGHTRHSQAVRALVTLLRAWEAELQSDRLDEAARPEALATLDRIAAALARQGDAAGWRALVEHALSRNPRFGATLDRLAELGLQDLSSAPQVVALLVDAVREALPRGVLSRLVARREHEVPALVGALAGTRDPSVRTLLEEAARRVPSLRAARPRAEAPAGPATPAFNGELARYSLPAILQRVIETRATGTLNLLALEGASAKLELLDGRVVGAHWEHRHGADAFYQLFLRPVIGRYGLDRARPAAANPIGELPALVREAIRRARELRRLNAVVPSDLPLEPTGAAPGSILREPEYELVVTLWQRACTGVPAARLEAELSADSYRILSPLSQWLEEGALRIAEAPSAGAAAGAAVEAGGTGGPQIASAGAAASEAASAAETAGQPASSDAANAAEPPTKDEPPDTAGAAVAPATEAAGAPGSASQPAAAPVSEPAPGT